MMKIIINCNLAISLLLLTPCVGCSQKHEGTQPVPLAAKVEQLPTPKKTLKPGAAVSLIAPQILNIPANQKMGVVLRLQVLQKGRLQVNLSTSEGLELMDTPTVQTFQIAPLQADAAEVGVPIEVIAAADGRYYVNLEAIVETDEGRSSRHLALVVQVSESGQQPVKALKPSNQSSQIGSESVISLPAQESITP